MAIWQMRKAKARLRELIEQAVREGPQTISRYGTARAIVVSIADYRALVARRPDFKAYLLGGPRTADLTIPRDHDPGRAVEL